MTAFRRVGRWLALLALCWTALAAADVAVPSLTARVTDLTGTLTAAQGASLEQELAALESAKGSQIAVLIVPSTAPESIEQYAMRVVEQWKLGRQKVDDGVLLLVAKEDRAIRIEVGYGLEGALTDAASKRIISDVITPRFRQGDYYGGISAGVDRISAVIRGEALPAPAAQPGAAEADSREQAAPLIFLLAIVAAGILRPLLGPGPGAVAAGGITAVVSWLLVGTLSVAIFGGVMAVLFTFFGRGLLGAMGGHHGGRGGGGFGGRGGGFGGGGASGRW